MYVWNWENWNLGKSYTVKQYNNDFNPKAVEFDQIIAAYLASWCKLKAQADPYLGVDGRFFSNSRPSQHFDQNDLLNSKV